MEMKPTYEEVIEAMARGIMEDIIAPWKHLDNDEKKTGKDIAKLALRALQDMMPDGTEEKHWTDAVQILTHFKTLGRDDV